MEKDRHYDAPNVRSATFTVGLDGVGSSLRCTECADSYIHSRTGWRRIVTTMHRMCGQLHRLDGEGSSLRCTECAVSYIHSRAGWSRIVTTMHRMCGQLHSQ